MTPYNRNVIGLIGRKRVGKDTVADRLVSRWNYQRAAHADALKEAAYALNPLIGDGLRLAEIVDSIGWEAAKNRDEVRRTLQFLGQAIRKATYEDVWADVIDARIAQASYGNTPPIVVTDVRLPNEVEQIRDYCGIIVRVKRPATPVGVKDIDSHISETALDALEPDYVIDNDGTIEELHRKVDDLIESL